jgi:hypothetical protein
MGVTSRVVLSAASGGSTALGRLRGRARFACGCARLAAARAAVLREIADQPVHRIEVGAVDQLAAFAPSGNEARALKGLEMERQRRGNQADSLRYLAGGKSVWTALDEEPEDREPMLVRERVQSPDYLESSHDNTIFRQLS